MFIKNEKQQSLQASQVLWTSSTGSVLDAAEVDIGPSLERHKFNFLKLPDDLNAGRQCGQ